MTKKLFVILLLFVYIHTLQACNKTDSADIVTTMYPQYDIAQNIVMDKMSVKLLTPLGSEVHGYSPTAKDIVMIKQSKLFIYTSDIMDRWISGVVTSDLNALDLSMHIPSIPLPKTPYVTLTDTIHYWTDPLVFMALIDVVLDEIITIDPANSAFYQDNARRYKNEIETTHLALEAFLEDIQESRRIYYFGHNAMVAFSYRYQLPILSLTDSYQPDAEFTPKQLEALVQSLIDNQVNYLFTEELIDLRGPESIVTELQKVGQPLTLLELHGYHNVSLTQFKKGVRYADLFEQNRQNIVTAFGA